MKTFNEFINENYEYANDAKDLKKQILADYSGVQLSFSERDEYVALDKIKVTDQGNGTGSEVMRHITDWADANDKILTLTPSADLGGSKPKLIKFYKKFGFIPNTGKNKIYEISDTMYRNPKF